MKARTLLPILQAVIWVSLMGFCACQETTDGPQVTTSHPIPANGNTLITAQRSYRMPEGFGRAVEDGRGGYFVTGASANATIARLDASQDTVWTDNALLRAGDIKRVATLGPWSDAVVVVGEIDVNSDGKADAGGVAFYDVSGTLIDTACVYSDTLAVNLRGVVEMTSGDPAVFVVVGEVTEGTRRPFSAKLSITSIDRTIRVLAVATHAGMDGTSFDAAAAAPPPTASLYVARNSGVATDVLEVSDQLQVGWTAPVVFTNAQSHRLRALVVSGGDVFASGEVRVDKGGFVARAGLVASISLAGDSNWVDSLSTGGLQDSFDGIAIANGIVYAAGRGSQMYVMTHGDNLGYGLFCGFDAATGEARFARTFGFDDRWSGFSSIFVASSSAVAFGFRQSPTNSIREGWYVEFDVPPTE